ncbi:MAG: phosphoglucomutase/phosphomannomutase family protein [Bacteroidia bacterium]|nr:phosphoglucomutase/phosphomannomutase family protein [Bacteroidia bacterium]
MTKIKFGTDGWRAIIADDFTVENVARVTEGVAKWLLKHFTKPSVVVGYDCRFGGKLFTETIAKVLVHHHIKVIMDKQFVSTPMISLATLKNNASLGIIITASHNPPEYNGYKLKGKYGGPLLPEKIEEVEALIPDTIKTDYKYTSLKNAEDKGLLVYQNFEDLYYNHVTQHFDLNAIKNSGLKFAYDSMYGAGQNIMYRLFPYIVHLHKQYNPSFYGQAPEPILRNLQEFQKFIQKHGHINCGLCTDGDADRIGLFDSKGNFVDSHHIILLLIKYLAEVKKYKGKIVTATSTTPRVHKLAKHLGLEVITVPIGFKHIAKYMITDDVLLGGEESGGIAIKGHIPERDGIWMGLTIWEYMAKSQKTLEELIQDVYKITGKFAYYRYDLHIDEDLKQRIISNCKAGKYTSFGKYKVVAVDTLDGYKYYLNNEQWVMLRASGTEPLLRIYGESDTHQHVIELLDTVKEIVLNA